MAGRPKSFNSVEEVQHKINKYFEYCEVNKKPYTMSGLAYYLEISRQTLVNYSYKDEYFDTIKRARDRVQMQLEENGLLNNANSTFTIFNLKNNFGWKEQSEIKQSISNNYKELSVEELKKLAGE